MHAIDHHKGYGVRCWSGSTSRTLSTPLQICTRWLRDQPKHSGNFRGSKKMSKDHIYQHGSTNMGQQIESRHKTAIIGIRRQVYNTSKYCMWLQSKAVFNDTLALAGNAKLQDYSASPELKITYGYWLYHRSMAHISLARLYVKQRNCWWDRLQWLWPWWSLPSGTGPEASVLGKCPDGRTPQ